MTRRSATCPQMPLRFRTFLIQPHSMPLVANKARTNVLKQNCSQKSQQNVNLQFREKSVDKNDLSPALRSETTSRRAWGRFCRKDFCTNLLIHNFNAIFCINSAFTKFQLALFCVLVTFLNLFYFTIDK